MLSELTLVRKIELWVPGKSMGKGTGRASISSGGKPFIFKDARTRNYEHMIRLLAMERAREIGLTVPHQGPVVLSGYYLYQAPKSVTRRGRKIDFYSGLQKLTKPDPTNLLKASEDGCTSVFWLDDCQVIGYRDVWKGYSSTHEGFLLVVYLYREPDPPAKPEGRRRKKT